MLEAGKGLTEHTIGANGCISASITVVHMTQLNHGLALSPDGKTVYVSAAPTAWSYSYDAKTMTATNQQVVVRGMNPGGHNSRTLAVPPNNPNLLIVSLGSADNIDDPVWGVDVQQARLVSWAWPAQRSCSCFDGNNM